MKKIMIMLGAVVLAACANAAAVNWQSGAVYTTTDNTVKIGKNNSDYVATISFFTDAAGTTAVSGLTGDLTISKSGTGSKYSGIVDGFSANTTYYAQLLITTEGYEAKSDVVAFTTPANGDPSIDFSDGTGFDTPYTFSTSVAGTWKATGDVPEPTSGLLLVLGVAGLALKRKRA